MEEAIEKRFNRGSVNGMTLIEHSIKRLGCGRSVLADKNGVIISGHDVYKTALELGKKTVTIETDGDVLVIVKRTDVEAEETKGKELQFVDNLASEKNLNWDTDALLDEMQKNLSFDPRKWGGYECLVKELELKELLRDDITLKDKKVKKEEPIEISGQLSLF